MKKIIVLAICLFQFGFAFSQGTETVELIVSEDAFLHGRTVSQNTNYGTINYLRATTWTNGGIAYTSRSILKFDLENINQENEIESATLYLYGNGSNPLTHSNSSKLYLVSSPWSESTVKWANHPEYNSQVYASISGTGPGPNNENKIIDLTSIVKMWHQGVANNGLLFKLDNETTYSEMKFHSKEASDASLRPKLVITYKKKVNYLTYWDNLNGQNITLKNYHISKTKKIYDNSSYIISKNYIPSAKTGSIKFMTINDDDDYKIGFCSNIVKDINSVHFGVNVKSNNTYEITSDEEVISSGDYKVGDVFLLKKEESQGTMRFAIYINDNLIKTLSIGSTVQTEYHFVLFLISANSYQNSIECSFYPKESAYYMIERNQLNNVYAVHGLIPLVINNKSNQTNYLSYELLNLNNETVAKVEYNSSGALSQFPQNAPLFEMNYGMNKVDLEFGSLMSLDTKYYLNIKLQDGREYKTIVINKSH
jgi:hypothetical protein